MGDARAPYELTLRFGVHSESYEEARAIGRKMVEQLDGRFVDGQEGAACRVELVDLRVERRGAMRP